MQNEIFSYKITKEAGGFIPILYFTCLLSIIYIKFIKQCMGLSHSRSHQQRKSMPVKIMSNWFTYKSKAWKWNQDISMDLTI
jgi:hypothetical protein